MRRVPQGEKSTGESLGGILKIFGRSEREMLDPEGVASRSKEDNKLKGQPNRARF